MVEITFFPFDYFEPKINMDLDRKMALWALEKKRLYFRWYGWKGLALSFGYSQCRSFKREKFNYSLKKICRPTGGGLLLHGWDISFALAAPKGLFKSHIHLYRFISHIFIETFGEMNINVDYVRGKKDFYNPREYCWNFLTFGELKVHNRKLVAAAARSFPDGSVLIHGSIYVSINKKFLKNFLPEFYPSMPKKIISLAELNIKKRQLQDLFIEKLIEKVKTLKLLI